MEALKPCSRCGIEPEQIWSDDVLFQKDIRAYAYRCPACSKGTNFSETVTEAQKIWNESVDREKNN